MFASMHDEKKLNLNDNFPTNFGMKIATSAGLLCKSEMGDKFINQYNDLAEFQQMACVNTLKQSMTCYYGKKLNKKQKEALELIYETTGPWLRSKALSSLMERLDNKRTGNHDFAESLKSIFEQMPATSDKGQDGKKGGKRLIVQVTGSAVQE